MSPLFGGNKGNDDGGARSAAQREAARVERERRRAAREGRPLPDEPGAAATPEPTTPEPVEPAPVAWDPAPEPAAPAEPELVAWEEEPVHGSEPGAEDPYAPASEAYEPAPVAETVGAGPDVQGEAPAEAEAPAGVVRRAPAPSVRDLPQVAGPTRQVHGRTRGVPPARPGRRLIPLVLLIVVVAIGYLLFRVFQPFAGDGNASEHVTVVIPQGATAGAIGDELQKQGVIDSAFFFSIRSRVSGQRADLKAGRFTLNRDMSYAAALDALTKNPAAAPTLKVAMPEGRSIREAGAAARASGLSGSYIKAATRNPREVKGFKGYGVPRGTRSLEGFLFPATYELKRKSTAKQLVAEQLSMFRRSFDGLDRRAAKRKNLSDYDVLVIASMIEREALVAKDRRLISAVIYNRLKQHIPLGIDATLRYSLNNWSRPLKQSELQRDSAFNTRTRQGLPPTPIGSPGLASIKAALSPAKVPYIFYVVKPCGKGAHAFSSTDAQFGRDVAAYNKKRAQLGGKDPSNC
jgi:UPF0755 protein